MPEPITNEQLATYLAAMDEARAERVRSTLAAMTPREQRLVKEAAVMGYVQGAWGAGGTRTAIPSDSQILAGVVTSCLSNEDRYPEIRRAQRRAVRRAVRKESSDA